MQNQRSSNSKKPLAACICCARTVTRLVMGEEFDYDETSPDIGFLLADEGLPKDESPDKVLMEGGEEDDTVQGEQVLKRGERLLVACADCMRDMIAPPSKADVEAGRRRRNPLLGQPKQESKQLEEDVTPRSLEARNEQRSSRADLYTRNKFRSA